MIEWSSPAISFNGTIYFGSNDHKLYAINPDGTEKWSYTTGGYVHSSPAIGTDGTIYVGSQDHKLYAINSNGTEKWGFTTGHIVDSSPSIGSDGTIYVGSVDKKFYAINPDGSEKWNFPTGSSITSSAAIGSDGTIFFGSKDYNVYAIYPNGTEKWHYTTSWNVQSSPTIGSDGTIYIGSVYKNLIAIGSPTPLIKNIDIDPDTLNLKSKGRWITCYITLNSPYDVSDIDISTILLEDTIPAEWGDIQGDTLMVKFDRSEVEDMLSPGTYNLKVTGELTDGTEFEGYSDEIRVIDPGK